MELFKLTNEKAFTILELLVVLVIVSSLLLLSIPSMTKSIERQQTKQFFELFKTDVFYIQNEALFSHKNIYILFEEDQYLIMDFRKVYAKRKIPTHIEAINTKNRQIRFSNNGTLYNPATYYFTTKETTYKVIFPFGKGRFYIDEV